MAAKTRIAATLTQGHVDAARVAILMCTKDGAAFLGDQLKSIADQTHANWILIVSDDGSTDDTRAILERFSESHSGKIIIRSGSGKGVCANFLSLASDPTIDADYFAFSDQDDIWYRDKIQRALSWLVTVTENLPALYCGRTELMSLDGRSKGFSPLFTRPPTFRNALVQNLGGGNTMVFNRAAKRLLEAASGVEVVLHDWWTYQLVSAAGGSVHYDSEPVLRYRQHPDNLIGSNQGLSARLFRIRMMLGGRFREWNGTNIAALRRLPVHLIRSRNREILELLANARSASLLKRLQYLRQSGVYRQTVLGNLGMLAAAVLKRI
jgi:glycosyltransferase involved in cell wall biosynthesis